VVRGCGGRAVWIRLRMSAPASAGGWRSCAAACAGLVAGRAACARYFSSPRPTLRRGQPGAVAVEEPGGWVAARGPAGGASLSAPQAERGQPRGARAGPPIAPGPFMRDTWQPASRSRSTHVTVPVSSLNPKPRYSVRAGARSRRHRACRGRRLQQADHVLAAGRSGAPFWSLGGPRSPAAGVGQHPLPAQESRHQERRRPAGVAMVLRA